MNDPEIQPIPKRPFTIADLEATPEVRVGVEIVRGYLFLDDPLAVGKRVTEMIHQRTTEFGMRSGSRPNAIYLGEVSAQCFLFYIEGTLHFDRRNPFRPAFPFDYYGMRTYEVKGDVGAVVVGLQFPAPTPFPGKAVPL